MPQALRTLFLAVIALLPLIASQAVHAADQTQPGPGNSSALNIARNAPLVQSAIRTLVKQAKSIHDPSLRMATLDILTNAKTCVLHRRGLATAKAQDAVIKILFDQGLIGRIDATNFPAGVRIAIFPPILMSDSACPQLPQPLESAPGSVFGGHHSYPGGLPVHELNNDISAVNLARQYKISYGGHDHELPIDQDVILAAPIWHDWAKTIVFQWNADGSEFAEFNFGGNGQDDAWGASGDSRTGAHHILGIAESMARGLSPLMVLTQASAHAAPTLGNEFKVVNWIRAAAVIARVDPLKAGYLTTDSTGHLRLPALGYLGNINLLDAGQSNLRVEYILHNLSDADYTFSGPAVDIVTFLLTKLAPEFDYDAADISRFNTRFRSPVLSHLSAERLLIIYGSVGLEAVRQELHQLRHKGII